MSPVGLGTCRNNTHYTICKTIQILLNYILIHQQ